MGRIGPGAISIVGDRQITVARAWIGGITVAEANGTNQCLHGSIRGNVIVERNNQRSASRPTTHGTDDRAAVGYIATGNAYLPCTRAGMDHRQDIAGLIIRYGNGQRPAIERWSRSRTAQVRVGKCDRRANGDRRTVLDIRRCAKEAGGEFRGIVDRRDIDDKLPIGLGHPRGIGDGEAKTILKRR